MTLSASSTGGRTSGPAFVRCRRRLENGFLAVQARLNGEPLEEYIRPDGGGNLAA